MNLEQDLRTLGFMWDGTTLHDAVVRFQTAYCGPPVGRNQRGWLLIDGIAGPATSDALDWTTSHGGRLSTFFAASETWCHHCGQNFVRRELLSALERLRALHGLPLYLLDVCRCPAHNKAVGGAPDSQHQYGSAADPKGRIIYSDVRNLLAFSGIGSRDGRFTACHFDVRHIFGPDLNHTGSTVNNPAQFVE